MRDRPRVIQEVVKVVVVGGYIKPSIYSNLGLPTVEIFSLVVNSWEKNGETFSETTGTWSKGRIKLAMLSSLSW